jgi:hypothetical protein
MKRSLKSKYCLLSTDSECSDIHAALGFFSKASFRVIFARILKS